MQSLSDLKNSQWSLFGSTNSKIQVVMPLLWRYLLRSYFQVFSLCVCGFIGILLATRFKEIASIATLGVHLKGVLLFTLYQIPYILPIAIPISGMISAFLLSSRLAQTHELTALRSAGMELKVIRRPLLCGAFFLAVINFATVSELTPHCRHLSYNLAQNAATINPLFLMKKSKMLKLEDSYVDMKMTERGKEAENIIFCVKNDSNERLTLMTAKNFSVESNILTGNDVTIISNLVPEKCTNYDNLIIENEQKLMTYASDLSLLVQKKAYHLSTEHLSLSALITTIFSHNSKPKVTKRAIFEVCRRLFYPLITFAFTFLGFSLGLQISRKHKKKGIYLTILMATLTFIASTIGKSFQLSPKATLLCYLLPFPLLLFVALWHEKKVTQGLE